MNQPLDERHANPRVYDSAIDRWIAVILLAAPVAAFLLGTVLLVQQRFADASIVLLTGALATVLTMAFTLPCRYTLLADAVNVRCGILCYTIPYDAIEHVERSSSWMSGPALSLRRVRIATPRRSYLLSPKHREAFIEDLQHRITSSRAATA